VGKASRDKGARRERELVNAFKGLGLRCERVPLSGAVRYQGNGSDLDLYLSNRAAPLVCEVKGRAAPAPWQFVSKSLGENDVLFLIEDRAEPLAVLPWRVLVELVTR
jgi:Holliday junction resolvase